MNWENILITLAVIAVLIVSMLISLTPQIVGITIYRLLRPRAGLLAAPICFLIPLVLYCAFFYYFWYLAPPPLASENPSGEGDLVIPALICLGLVMNLGFGLTFYVNRILEDWRQTRAK